jgi:hypothetical protein
MGCVALGQVDVWCGSSKHRLLFLFSFFIVDYRFVDGLDCVDDGCYKQRSGVAIDFACVLALAIAI